MAPVRLTAAGASHSRDGTLPRRWPDEWPLLVALLGFPLHWVLGISAFIWLVVCPPVLLWLWGREHVRVPRGLGLWLLFLGWVTLSAVSLDGLTTFLTFSYRLALYAASAILLVFTFNLPWHVRADRVLGALAGLWTFVVLAGVAAVVLPPFTFNSVLETLLPPGFTAEPFVHQLVHPTVAQTHSFLGYEVNRPAAPFSFTNEWGGAVSLLAPMFVCWLVRQRTAGRRLVGAAVLPLAAFPVINSLNRGAWIAMLGAAVFVGVRLALRGHARAMLGLVGGTLAIVALVGLTPLGDMVADRREEGHSDQSRRLLYERSLNALRASPIIGHGAPQRDEERASRAPAGTHGQLWMIAVSHGVPAAVVFVAFLGLLTKRLAGGGVTSIRFWGSAAVFVALLQLPFYSLLPAGIPLLGIIGGLGLREPVGHPPRVRDTR